MSQTKPEWPGQYFRSICQGHLGIFTRTRVLRPPQQQQRGADGPLCTKQIGHECGRQSGWLKQPCLRKIGQVMTRHILVGRRVSHDGELAEVRPEPANIRKVETEPLQ